MTSQTIAPVVAVNDIGDADAFLAAIDLTGKAGALAGQSLLSQISSSTQGFQIKPNRLQPEGSDGVSVWFDDVNFNNLVRWLEAQAQQGITVRQISIDRDDLPGTVSARVILQN